MRIDPQIQAARSGGTAGQGQKGPSNPAEAARQFEEVLVREFVRTMTKDLFSSSLAGEEGAGWVKAQGDAQADALTDAVTKHLLESGGLGVSEILMKRWDNQASGTDRPPGAEPIELEVNPIELTTTAHFNLLAAGKRTDGDD